MPNNTVAVWSAIAGWFAAGVTSLALLIQRRNLLESVRPELVLDGWTRRVQGHGDSAHEVITFQTIQNVGRGTALHLFLNAKATVDNRPTYLMSAAQIPILAPGGPHDINGKIDMWWQNVRSDDGKFKHLAISVEVLCQDSQGRCYETRYNLHAVELSSKVVVTNPIAPGVMLARRTTVARSVWLPKPIKKLWRVPGLRRFRRKPE